MGYVSRLTMLTVFEAEVNAMILSPAIRDKTTCELRTMRDRYDGRALALLHERPAQAWTLNDLAKEGGLSRFALAERFAHFVGQPPMQYLTQWRMQLAAGLLARGTANMATMRWRSAMSPKLLSTGHSKK
jgi:AraC-like DNA-binding protein